MHLLVVGWQLEVDMTPLELRSISLQVSEEARAGLNTAFPFEVIKSLINGQHGVNQHKTFFFR